MSLLSHPRAPEAAALAAPVLLVAIFRLLSPSAAPASALADEPAPSINPAALTEALPEGSRAAALFAREALAQPLNRSPFALSVAGMPAPEPSGRTGHAPEPTRPVIAGENPQFILTSVMVSNTGSVVVISGRLYRLHDSPAPGWTITGIDPARRTASLISESGATIALSLSAPIPPQR